MIAGQALATRIEAADAQTAVACSQAQARLAPELPCSVQSVAGGYAIFLGAGSPLTHALGLGMEGPVSAADMETMEHFYRIRGSGTLLELCPLAHPSLVTLVGERGYRLTELNNVLVRPFTPGEAFDADPRIGLAAPELDRHWAFTVGQGFFDRDELSTEEMNVGMSIFHMPGSQCYWMKGVACGALALHQGMACLFADSTRTMERSKGLQAALIRARLAAAAGAGCDVATASTLPGSGSQRNYERMGFRVVYTRIALTRDA